MFKQRCLENDPIMADDTIEYLLAQQLETEFPTWFEIYARDPVNNITCPYVRALASGPLRGVVTFQTYVVNGLRFDTRDRSVDKQIANSGVSLLGSDIGGEGQDFYGTLRRIVRLEYPGEPLKRTVLFDVDWYEPGLEGTKVHDQYELVEINKKKKYKKYEPFLLATQATQAVFFPYPGASRAKADWLGVIPIRARSKVEYVDKDESITNSFQSELVDKVARRPLQVGDEEFDLHEDQFVELELEEHLLGKLSNKLKYLVHIITCVCLCC